MKTTADSLLSLSPADCPAMTALLHSDCPKLQLIATGKVRDIYSLPDDPSVLLFVTTDRVSAFDVTMKNVAFFSICYLALVSGC